ncbi:MAG TPA: GvpL/GvpF family gas vesicle protein [Solirubrobacteraceae bacterium]|jgi:hypothetical protein
MTLLVYAIADAEHALPPRLSGLDDDPLRSVAHGGLSAVVGECNDAPTVTPAALVRFEQTVEELMGDGTVLPARFGTILSDEAAVEQLLSSRHDQLADALRRVTGAVELGVRAAWPDDDAGPNRPPGPHAGAEYLLGRLERRRRAQQLAAEIDAAVGDLARESACRILARPESPVTAAYLVSFPRVDEFLARCHNLEATIADASLVCTGPWPPYSFVTREQP